MQQDCQDIGVPPSLHMRLGHGLANAPTVQSNIYCFDWEANSTPEEIPEKKKMLSESDLLSIFGSPEIDASQADKVEIIRKLSTALISSGSFDASQNGKAELIRKLSSALNNSSSSSSES